MKLENLTLSELLNLRECINILNTKYQNMSILEGKSDNKKCINILKLLEKVMNEIEKRVLMYD